MPYQPTSKVRPDANSACCYWLTGLPAAGKSTLALSVKEHLSARQVQAVVLDGDELRKGLNAGLGFDRKDRAENVRRIAHVARLFVEAGMVTIVSVIAPYREDRRHAREIFSGLPYFEVFVDAPLEICQARDPKGLYRRNLSGLTGISAPYEAPLAPDLRLNTAHDTLAHCTATILAHYMTHYQERI